MRKEDMVPGVKVLCINDQFFPRVSDPFFSNDELVLPKLGQVYTIREAPIPTPNGDWGVYLEEIHNPPFHYDDAGMKEICFDPSRFEIVIQH